MDNAYMRSRWAPWDMKPVATFSNGPTGRRVKRRGRKEQSQG
uniref:Uncharacterized protein n=1 Tax=Picea glauca TaxID=3330 RepID=A0A101LWF2_PICGL|nr:hypothetical protein ABT39_MTgene1719 [Picea glauca]KUM47215.1 hypothetical protein ABT39_MTgene6221 [Picea glauca]KUM49730.1 hypothetical protein ABT39_MTgene2957 [Picea glauca]